MTPRRRKRLALVAILVLGAASATALAVNAFSRNLVYFYTPSQVAQDEAPSDRTFRIGGLVTDGSVEHSSDALATRFTVTDTHATVAVRYNGDLPDLFREGQGVVVDGKLNDSDVLVAQRVLAKHDSDYMPPEAKDALEQARTGDVPAASGPGTGNP